MLGGLRVYLNALFGTDLAAVHGSFSQIVFALTIAVAVLTTRRKPIPLTTLDARRRHRPGRHARRRRGLRQIVCGAVLRHGTTAWGPRLHLLVAFVAVLAVVAAVRALRGAPAALAGWAAHDRAHRFATDAGRRSVDGPLCRRDNGVAVAAGQRARRRDSHCPRPGRLRPVRAAVAWP